MIDSRQRGFSLIEILVVCGLVGILASLVFPALAEARSKARVSQCTAHLRGLGQALVLYDTDHDRQWENYPDRITHLFALGYTRDPRMFVCPMDYTKAKDLTLKPGNPKDNKNDWRERRGLSDPTGLGMQDCSYLYEFSTRGCQSYTYNDATAQWEWIGGGWCSDVMVGWYSWDQFVEMDDFDYLLYDGDYELVGDNWVVMLPARPPELDRDGDHLITWQEVKFWQMENADAYTTGMAGPGERNISPVWSTSPYDTIWDGTESRQRLYPRSWMPIVRCFWHQSPEQVDYEGVEEVLNLAVDGNTFYSAPGWEQTAWKYGRQADEDKYLYGP